MNRNKKNLFIEIYNQHEQYRKASLNLMPSENLSSPLSKKFLSGDMGSRYFFKNTFSSNSGLSYAYSGTKYIDEITTIGEGLVRKLFNAKFASLYPLSGHLANMAILFGFTKPGDKIIVYDTELGGYPGLDKNKLPKYMNLNTFHFPVIEGKPEIIDIEKTIKLIYKIKPSVIIYSSAHTLFPIDVNRIANATKEVGSVFVYDASHPLGIIAGGLFQSPLNEGADILIAGTQKSFPGPQGGLIAANRFSEVIQSVEHFVIVDNPHFNRIAALTVSLAEMTEFGSEYATQVVKNTKSLAKYLDEFGFSMKYKELDFTESHMAKMEMFNGFADFVKKLEKCNIMIDTAGRIGTAEMTRLGMREEQMSIIAKLIHDCQKGISPSKIKKEVLELRNSFNGIKFCYQ